MVEKPLKEWNTWEWIEAVEAAKKNIAPVFETTKDQRIASGIVALLESADDPLIVLEATRLAYEKMCGYSIRY